jgi:hypothetical protein
VVKPGYYQHQVKQGEDYSVVLELQTADGNPFDNTGYAAQSQMRTLDGELAAEFVTGFPSSSSIRLSLPNTVTTVLPPKRYLHDLKLVSPSSEVGFYLDGDVIVSRVITRVGG